MLREAAELDKELEESRVKAVRLRAEQGAFLGVMESGTFSLGNPGGGPDLLERASYTLQRGKSYALVGRNGCGKSTLLKAMASRRVGEIHPAVTVHYVHQEVSLTEESLAMTPVEIVVNADVERRLLLAEAATFERAERAERASNGGERCSNTSTTSFDGARQQEVLEQLSLIESDTCASRAQQLLVNLGFSDELIARPMSALSGGWRVRTALAAAIFGRPDMLLLDEPTNHLSIGAVLWLVRELTTNPVWEDRTIVVVSHDRFFLDEVCGDVLHVSGVARRLTQSHGSYSTWSQRRAEQQKAFAKQVELRRAEIAELKEYAGHGFKYGGSSSSINKMKMKEKQVTLTATANLAANPHLSPNPNPNPNPNLPANPNPNPIPTPNPSPTPNSNPGREARGGGRRAGRRAGLPLRRHGAADAPQGGRAARRLPDPAHGGRLRLPWLE